MATILEERERDGTLPSNVHNLEDVFSTVEEPVYIDYVHTPVRATASSREALFERLREHLCGTMPPNVSARIADAIAASCG